MINNKHLLKFIKNTINEELNRNEYLKWKRKNVSYRGMRNLGQENKGSAVLGKGLYSASLSNKSMAKTYGDVYFMVNGVPKNPKIFNTFNEWDIWFFNVLVNNFTKKNNLQQDQREFFKHTNIENEMMKLGYDGILIKGREMVNYKPENIKYFKTEDEVYNYYLNSES